MQQLDRAIAAFERAVELRGSYTRASHNLLLLNKARRPWEAQQRTEAEQVRPGPGQTGAERGAGGTADLNALSGESERDAQLSTSEDAQNGKRERVDAALEQSLAQWSRLPESDRRPPLQAWQQYRNLKEEDRPLLQRRFEIEDKRALGWVEEKPW